MDCASRCCDHPRDVRRTFSALLSLRRSSTMVDSSGDRAKNCSAEPTVHPALFNWDFFFLSILFCGNYLFESSQSFLTHRNHRLRCVLGFLAEHLKNHDRVTVNAINDSPYRVHIGREWGIGIDSPCCSFRSKNPASTRAFEDSGGVFTSPPSQTNGLSASVFVSILYQM